MIRDTTQQAYDQLDMEHVSNLEASVYKAIHYCTQKLGRHPTDREITRWLNYHQEAERQWEVAAVTARRNGLLAKNIVIASTKIKQNGRTVYTWALKHPYSPVTIETIIQ